MKRFFPDYFARLSAFVAAYIPPNDFMPRLMKSTTMMINDIDPKLTNQEVFVQEFFAGLDEPEERLMSVFESFYTKEFPKLRCHSAPVDSARAVVEKVLGSGRQVVVATAPVFPRVAIVERLRWAGLDDLPFTLVTAYENMHFCKPQPQYYLEIAGHLGCRPEECLMVGNDVEEDMVAKDAGMATFLAEPNVIHRGERPANPDYRGVLDDVPAALDGTPLPGA